MLSLTYVSCSLVEEGKRAETLDDIQTVSIARNTALDITGLLIATSQHFTQVLEGPTRSIDTVMTSILADPRHRDIRITSREKSSVRRFPLWRMARFDGENFGKISIGPLLAAAHAQDDPAAGRKLDRLIESIAFNGVSARI